MGTRGLMGVRVNGKDKFTYNHFDSYPDGLGKDFLSDVAKMLKEIGFAKMKELAENIRLVDENKTPPATAMRKYRKFYDGKVGDPNKTTWYNLLRDLQGSFKETLEAGIMINSNSFIKDSLFCEWGYVLNFDEKVIEVYKGFQKSRPYGRYTRCKPSNNGYYACSLIMTVPLEENLQVNKIVEKMNNLSGE